MTTTKSIAPTAIHSRPSSHQLMLSLQGWLTAAIELGEAEAYECVGTVRSEVLPRGTIMIDREGVGDWIGSGDNAGVSVGVGILLGDGPVVADALDMGVADVGTGEREASGAEEVESTVGGSDDGSANADPPITIPSSTTATTKPARAANFRKGIPPKGQDEHVV